MNFILIIPIIILLIKFYKFWQKKCEIFKKVKNIPAPKAYPIVGTLHHFMTSRERMFQIDKQFTKLYGPVHKLWSISTVTVVLSNCSDIETVLASPKHLDKGFFYAFLHPWIGDGLLTSTGPKWKLRRKLLTPAFHYSILNEFLNIFNEETDKLVGILRKTSNETPCIAVNALVSRFTLNSISETAMAIKLDDSTKTAKEYKSNIYRVGELFIDRMLKVWLYNDFVYKHSKNGQEFTRHVKMLHDFTNKIIGERRQMIFEKKTELQQKKKAKALLDVLLGAQQDNNDISDEGIREEVDTFMFEGQDTTYTAICFLLMNIANHPAVQEKMYDEIMDVLGNDQPTIENLSKLTYTELCIKETLRLYPSVPSFSRSIKEDIHLPSGFIVPNGAMVRLDVFMLHRNPEIFPDPEKFIPERFALENVKGRHPFAYLPFSAGPRNCIGQKFAMLEMKSVISGILRHFQLEAVDKPESLTFVADLILRTKDDIKVKFLPRHES